MWAGHVARVVERRGAHGVLVEKPEGRRPLERSSCRWENIIKMHIRELGRGICWIDLAQDMDRWRAIVNAVMNLRIP